MTTILVENHRRFHQFLSYRVGNSEVAEDLLQLALKKALENPARAEDEGTVVAWFYRVLKNTLTDFYRSRAREENGNEEFLHSLTASGADRERSLDDLEADVCACLGALLPTLKPGYRQLLERLDFKAEPIAEVARDLGVTENNLSVRLHRARKALKVSLERACGTCTEHGCLSCSCE